MIANKLTDELDSVRDCHSFKANQYDSAVLQSKSEDKFAEVFVLSEEDGLLGNCDSQHIGVGRGRPHRDPFREWREPCARLPEDGQCLPCGRSHRQRGSYRHHLKRVDDIVSDRSGCKLNGRQNLFAGQMRICLE